MSPVGPPKAQELARGTERVEPVSPRSPGERIAGGVLRRGLAYRLHPAPGALRHRAPGPPPGRDAAVVLSPRPGLETLPAKALGPATAALWHALAQPGEAGPLAPPGAPPGSGAFVRTVAALVLDRVLEIDLGDGFVTGPAACATLYGGVPTPPSRDRTGLLSARALAEAERLQGLGVAALAARLYAHGRPGGGRLARSTSDGGRAVERALGIGLGSGLRARLDRSWHRVRARRDDPWLVWRSLSVRTPLRREGPTPKLYVSPRDGYEAAALEAVVSLADTCRVFKVAAAPGGLSRPDKMVLYFEAFADLAAAAATLAPALAGVPAAGVPFTASVTTDGLLCWGVDPPPLVPTGPGQAGGSWRQWVTWRLAIHLTVGRPLPTDGAAGAGGYGDGPTAAAPLDFALARVRLDGVDPDGWVPGQRLWAHHD